MKGFILDALRPFVALFPRAFASAAVACFFVDHTAVAFERIGVFLALCFAVEAVTRFVRRLAR